MSNSTQTKGSGCVKRTLKYGGIALGVLIALVVLVQLLPGTGSEEDISRDNVVPTFTPPPVQAEAAPTPPVGEQQPEEPIAPPPTNTAAVVNLESSPTPLPSLASQQLGQPAVVVNIVDGDTIDVVIDGQEYRVRYILMDTPEKGDPFFTEATEANRALVGGRTVYLQKDVSETDRYGRLLRYIYLEDGTFVNGELVRRGYAQLATFPPDVSKEAEIRAAQQEAVASGQGLWATSAPVAVSGAVANQAANLRAGPGTDHNLTGSVAAGQALVIVGMNQIGDWYQLENGSWIAAFLVDNPPSGVPVVETATQPDPPEGVATPALAACDCSGNSYNCGDFSTHVQAQACYDYCIDQGSGDIHRLDRDSDGSACETLP